MNLEGLGRDMSIYQDMSIDETFKKSTNATEMTEHPVDIRAQIKTVVTEVTAAQSVLEKLESELNESSSLSPDAIDESGRLAFEIQNEIKDAKAALEQAETKLADMRKKYPNMEEVHMVKSSNN